MCVHVITMHVHWKCLPDWLSLLSIQINRICCQYESELYTSYLIVGLLPLLVSEPTCSANNHSSVCSFVFYEAPHWSRRSCTWAWPSCTESHLWAKTRGQIHTWALPRTQALSKYIWAGQTSDWKGEQNNYYLYYLRVIMIFDLDCDGSLYLPGRRRDRVV